MIVGPKGSPEKLLSPDFWNLFIFSEFIPGTFTFQVPRRSYPATPPGEKMLVACSTPIRAYADGAPGPKGLVGSAVTLGK